MKQPAMYWLFFVITVLLLPVAQASPPSQLPDTPAGKQVAGYISAFNAGEGEMREFIKLHWAAEALKALPLDARVDRSREIRKNVGTLQLYRVLAVTTSSISTVIRSEKDGWLEFSFGFDDSPGRAITRISIQEADDPDQAPVHPTASVEELLTQTGSYLDSLFVLDQFSGVVSIVRHDSLLFTRAYGYADRENKIPTFQTPDSTLGQSTRSLHGLPSCNWNLKASCR